MKKLITVLLSLSLLLCSAPAAFAASIDDNDGSMYVYYNVENAYSINIPESYDLGENSCVDFTPNYVHTTADKQISVYIMQDGIAYKGKGEVYLSGSSTNTYDAKMKTHVMVGSTPESIDWPITDDCVCTFYGDNGEISFIQGPYMRLAPELGAGITCGEYSATLFFDVVVENHAS